MLTFWVTGYWTSGILCLNMWWQPTQLTVSNDVLTSDVLICDSALTSMISDPSWDQSTLNRPSAYRRLLIWWWLSVLQQCQKHHLVVLKPVYTWWNSKCCWIVMQILLAACYTPSHVHRNCVTTFNRHAFSLHEPRALYSRHIGFWKLYHLIRQI